MVFLVFDPEDHQKAQDAGGQGRHPCGPEASCQQKSHTSSNNACSEDVMQPFAGAAFCSAKSLVVNDLTGCGQVCLVCGTVLVGV